MMELKNICQVEHTRQSKCSRLYFNIMSAIAAYSFFPKKPSIKKILKKQILYLLQQLNQQKLIAA